MSEMKLWLLTREEPDWDEYLGFVVRAPDAEAARCEALIAAGINVEKRFHPENIGCREPWWGDPELTTCVEVFQDGPAGVVLDSFQAG